MKKIFWRRRWIIFTWGIMMFCLPLGPATINAAMFYHCLDDDGNEMLVDGPVDGWNCKRMETYDEEPSELNGKKAEARPEEKITKITVKGNQVFVPVKLAYEGREIEAKLLLDTGASATTIHPNVADRFYINLYRTQKIKARVVGGNVLEASVVKMDYLKIGPHTVNPCTIYVVPNEGNTLPFDGLLGMDVLGSFSYRIDLKKQVIIWEE